ncbi:hypothetical protein ABZZ36_32235 [Actinacidiphila glaucinigra]|uniref:hypothetical protein n=1 Tax=Actinacidiphila glaucinigra TaxID=235986 RepID=UPI0033BF84FC
MTRHGRSRVRLLLSAAIVLVLLGCTTAAWLLPRPVVASPSGAMPQGTATVTVAGSASPCELIAGPARAYCTASESGSRTTSAAGRGAQGWWLLGFSTAAIAAAVALIVTTGRHR